MILIIVSISSCAKRIEIISPKQLCNKMIKDGVNLIPVATGSQKRILYSPGKVVSLSKMELMVFLLDGNQVILSMKILLLIVIIVEFILIILQIIISLIMR